MQYIDQLIPTISNIVENFNVRVSAYNQTSNVFCRLKRECDKYYVVTTKQSLKYGLTQHRSDSMYKSHRCMLANHVKNTKHAMKYDENEILAQESSLNRRLFLELIYIQIRDETLINKKVCDKIRNID